MLKAASSHARLCYERALEARERALKTDDPSARDEFLASEVRWLKLAQSYEFSEQLTQFLKKPLTFPEHPVCPRCGVPMWLVEMDPSSEKTDYFYECKACEGKLTLTAK